MTTTETIYRIEWRKKYRGPSAPTGEWKLLIENKKEMGMIDMAEAYKKQAACQHGYTEYRLLKITRTETIEVLDGTRD